jgi:hypothetical protein
LESEANNEPLVKRWHSGDRPRYQPVTLDEAYVTDLITLRRFWLARRHYDPRLHGPALYGSKMKALRIAHRRVQKLRQLL